MEGLAYQLAQFLLQPRSTCRRLHHTPWAGPHTAISNQENIHTDARTGKSNGGNSSVEVPSSQVTVVCEKLTDANYANSECIFNAELAFPHSMAIF